MKGPGSTQGLTPPGALDPSMGPDAPASASATASSHGDAPSAASGLALVQAYRESTGIGVFLRALDGLNYTEAVAAGRQDDRASLDATLAGQRAQVERLLALGSRQRVLLASTPLSAAIRGHVRGGEGRLSIAGVDHAVAYPTSPAQSMAAVQQVADEWRLGEVNLAAIAVEAEHPGWPFMHALRMHTRVDAGFTFTGEVMDVVAHVHAPPIYVLKHLLNIERPHRLDATIKPWISVPAHAAFPSGHSTYAHAMAVVLNALAGPGDPSALLDLAAAVARRRELAGLHTRLDSAMGAELGQAIGKHLVEQATQGSAPELAPWRILFAMAGQEWAG